MSKNLLETFNRHIDCWECAFDENCENLFPNHCVANYAKDENYEPDAVCCLKYCEKDHYSDLTEDEKKEFIEMLKKVCCNPKKLINNPIKIEL